MEKSLLSVYCQVTSFVGPVSQGSPAKATISTDCTGDVEASEEFLRIVSQLQGKGPDSEIPTSGVSTSDGSLTTDYELTKRSLTVKSSEDGYGFVLRAGAPAVVCEIREDSCANRASLLRGDLIAKVNGHDVSNRSHGDLVNLINYMPNSPITFTVLTPSYADGASDSELRRAWARHYLPNFLASPQQSRNSPQVLSTTSRSNSGASLGMGAGVATDGSTLPSPSQRATPPPPQVRPRGQSSASAVQRYVEHSLSASKSASSSSIHSPVSPMSSASADGDGLLDATERKKLLLKRGTVNIFAVPTTPSKTASSSTTSIDRISPLSSPARVHSGRLLDGSSAAAQRTPPRPSKFVTSGEGTPKPKEEHGVFSTETQTTPATGSKVTATSKDRPTEQVKEAEKSTALDLNETPTTAPKKPTSSMASQLASEPALNTSQTSLDAKGPTARASSVSKTQVSKQHLPRSEREKRFSVPSRPPPKADVAMRKLSRALDLKLPLKKPGGTPKRAREASAAEVTPRRSSGAAPPSPGSVRRRLSVRTAAMPAWQWSAEQVRKWLIVNEFKDASEVDRVKGLEGLQLLSMKANGDVWSTLGRDRTNHLLVLINGLRKDLSLEEMFWDEPEVQLTTPQTPLTDRTRMDLSNGPTSATANVIDDAVAHQTLETRVKEVPMALPRRVMAVNVAQRPQRPPAPQLTKQGASKASLNGPSTSDVSDWQALEVDAWLQTFGELEYMLYAGVFAENAITGHTLLRLDNHKLVSMGITDQALRKQMLQEVEQLRLRHEEREMRRLLSNPTSRQQLMSKS